MANSTRIRKRAEQLKGRPVCITLYDGRTYVGWISGLDKEGLTLSKSRRHKKSGRKMSSRSRKATVSGFMPLLGSLFGNPGGGTPGNAGIGGSGFGGLMGFIGMMQKAMPVMKMGYNMIKSISPFMAGLKGLMG